MDGKPKIVILRGHQATPWELSIWEGVREAFDVRVLLTGHNAWDVSSVDVPFQRVRTLGSMLPRGRASRFLLSIVQDRYIDLARHLRDADIVHALELSNWFSAQAASMKGQGGLRYKLVQTVWETIPLRHTYRHHHARHYRRVVLEHTDCFLAATERARRALLLEGVPEQRVRVCAPGVDASRFTPGARQRRSKQGMTILSVGRLVWEKGHQDVIRAVAAIHRGLLKGKLREPPSLIRLRIVGDGPERARLRAHADELGIGDLVDIGSVQHEAMATVYTHADALVLASLPCALKPYHLLDRPRIFWEEQFGMVLAEAAQAGVPIVASRSGAIPEVVGASARLFDPGDWWTLARILVDLYVAEGSVPERSDGCAGMQAFTHAAATERLCSAYRDILRG